VDVKKPAEALLDAKVLRVLSKRCRRQAETLSANATSFSVAEYAERLKVAMGIQTGNEGDEHVAPLKGRKLTQLGKTELCFFPQ